MTLEHPWSKLPGGAAVLAVGIATSLAAFGLSESAHAHPHIWVSVETTMLFDNGAVTGIRHRWTFDEFYSNMAIQGLDANNDGIFDRKELAELAKINVDGLQEMGFFTHVKLGAADLKFGAPKDYWLDHAEVTEAPGPAGQIEEQPKAAAEPEKKSAWGSLVRALGVKPKEPTDAKTKTLALEFTLPLAAPVLVGAEGFTYAVYDPDFMIWFDLAKTNGAQLKGAPAGCTAVIGSPKEEASTKNLSEAFASQLGGTPFSANAAKSITLKCPKA